VFAKFFLLSILSRILCALLVSPFILYFLPIASFLVYCLIQFVRLLFAILCLLDSVLFPWCFVLKHPQALFFLGTINQVFHSGKAVHDYSCGYTSFDFTRKGFVVSTDPEILLQNLYSRLTSLIQNQLVNLWSWLLII
jgi:hypothetical protein